MSPVNASSFGRKGAFVRRWPGGTEKVSILRTVLRWMPKRRAASRWLSPSTWQAWRTRPSSSTENIPAFPGSFRTRSKKALSRYSLVPPRPDYPAAVSVEHFVSAALSFGDNGARSGTALLVEGRHRVVDGSIEILGAAEGPVGEVVALQVAPGAL